MKKSIAKNTDRPHVRTCSEQAISAKPKNLIDYQAQGFILLSLNAADIGTNINIPFHPNEGYRFVFECR